VTKRPVVRYYGGKAALAPWIISHMPAHRVYVEPFGGGAAVLLQKPRAAAEVYNDLEGDLVNLYRVLRNPRDGRRLVKLVALTPFAREEFVGAYEPSGDAVERARRLLVRSHMGHGGEAAAGRKTGFRYLAHRKELRGTHPATDWARLPAALAEIIVRCQGLVVEQCDALQVLRRYDGADTLHYVDPPYLKALRSCGSRHLYTHDLDEADHIRLAEVLKGLAGAVLLSGYGSPLYDDLYGDWHREERWSVVQAVAAAGKCCG
jgi:DNA adenine methylase